MKQLQRNVRGFLEKWLQNSVRKYVSKMDGKVNNSLYHLIMDGVEKPLIEMVLIETNWNQTLASNILGINRNTLRKKIQDYGIKCKSSH